MDTERRKRIEHEGERYLNESPGLAVIIGEMIMIASCASQPSTPPASADPGQPSGLTGVLKGKVTYRERIALAADAIVEVVLQEVSRADAPATSIASQTIETQGAQVPIPFALTYDPAQITRGIPRRSEIARRAVRFPAPAGA